MTLVATPTSGSPQPQALGGHYEMLLDIAISGSYVTGGDALDLTVPAKRGGGRGTVLMVLFEDLAGHQFLYDRTNKKVLVYTTAGTQLTAAAYPAGVTGNTVRALMRFL